MNIVSIITSLILSDSGISNLIGTRIYPNKIEQGSEFPQLAHLFLEKPPTNGQGGICARNFEFAIHITSFDYDEALDLKERLITLLNNYKGIVSGVNIGYIVFDGDSLNLLENDTELYHITLDFVTLINI